MCTNVNLAAPIGVMLLLGTVLLLAILSVVFLYSLFSRRYPLLRWTLLLFGLVAIVYLASLLLFSFFSHEQLLASGQEKHFCELDCHLAYSVADVKQADELSSPGKRIKPSGTFYLVTIQTRFDEKTIGPRRGNGLLSPNPRSIVVVDSDGRQFLPDASAQAVLLESNAAGTPIDTPLRPGQSYSTVYAFDLPRNIHSPRLLLNESDWVTRLIIGHENSIAHKKALFQLNFNERI